MSKKKLFSDQKNHSRIKKKFSRIKKKLKPCKERKESSASGPPGPPGALVRWSSDALVLWSSGPLMPWSSGAGPLQQRSKQRNCTGEVGQGNWKDSTGRRINGDQKKGFFIFT